MQTKEASTQLVKNTSDKKKRTKEGQNCYAFLIMMHFVIMIHVFRVLEN